MTRGQFSPDQVERLLRPIKESRVYSAQGQAHAAGWDIAAHLTRMFGFGGWEKEILELVCVAEDHAPEYLKDKKNWFVTYRCRLRLRVFDPDGRLAFVTDDVGTGTSPNLPSRGDAHDFAAKNAVTYALKRCAKDLGDQFGLSLYNKGATGAVVCMTLVGAPDAPAVDHEPDVTVEGEGDDHEPADVLGDGNGVDLTEIPGQALVVETVTPEQADDWLGLMNTIEDEVIRTGVKNRFKAEFGAPFDVPAGSEEIVEAWITDEIARVTGPLETTHDYDPDTLDSEAF